MNGKSLLGGVPVRETVSQPRALTRDGTPDLAVFVFYLCAASDRSRLETGAIAELQTVAREDWMLLLSCRAFRAE